MPAKIGSINARKALETLGTDLKTSRLKRRISIKSFAERIGMAESTVIRLEKGHEGVSIGTLAMACLVLGELDRISNFLDPGSDDTGLLLDRERLPKRISRKRKHTSLPDEKKQNVSSEVDEDGVGF